MTDTQDVLFEKQANLGIITLNRPKALNALNHGMFLAMDKQLTAWEMDDEVQAVVIRAVEGKAFCAGGDIRAAYQMRMEKNPALPHFFRDEYRLNRHIFYYTKPYIALLDGITMGGGAGISVHGSHRVGTKNLSFAMPETGIGFYPDVGGTYFLPRLPHKIGFYLGLTGARISYHECAALGITQHTVAQETLPKIIDALKKIHISNREDVTAVLQTFTIAAEASSIIPHKNEIEKYFSKNSVEEILQGLIEDSNPWCQETAEILAKKSPTSLKVTLRALQQNEKVNFDTCMKTEFRLTNHFLHGHDFFEGIRAVVIDKDQNPQWKPEKLDLVTTQEVEAYFLPLEKELV